MRKYVYPAGTVIFLTLSILFGWKTVEQFRSMGAQQSRLKQLAGQLPQPSDYADVEAVLEERLTGYAKLSRKNRDFAGWITIPDTAVDYPVMYAPDRPDYYLKRDFDRRDSDYGIPYLEEACDPQNPGNLIVYGHNMADGSMFKTVTYYKELDYLIRHPYIYFDTMDSRRTYQVVYGFETNAREDSFPYETYTGVQDEARFREFVENCEKLCTYRSGITPELGDEFLILSTCFYTELEGRFVVVARRVQS